MAREYATKIGYVRVCAGDGNIANMLRYEDLYIKNRLRQTAAYQAATAGGGIYCTCQATNSVKIRIESNGSVRLPDPSLHTQKCIDYMQPMTNYIDSTPLGSLLKGAPMSVGFNFMNPRVGIKGAYLEDFDLTRKKSLPLSTFILLNNWLAFSGAYPAGINIYDSQRCARTFLEVLREETIVYPGKTQNYCVKPQGGFLYRKEMENGDLGFYYGRINKIPEKYNSGKGTGLYLFVSPMGDGYKDIFLRVPKNEFQIAYEDLPDTGNAYICGFIRARDLKIDASEQKLSTGVINPGKISSSHIEKDYTVKRVYEMKHGCVFSCNRIGLAVFDRNELEASDRLLDAGRIVYRPLYGSVENGHSLMVFNHKGKDIPIKEFYE